MNLYNLRVIVAVVVKDQLDIPTCTAQIVHKLYVMPEIKLMKATMNDFNMYSYDLRVIVAVVVIPARYSDMHCSNWSQTLLQGSMMLSSPSSR